MAFIVIVIAAIYLLVFAWSWNNLEDTDKPKKIILILVGILIVFIITNIIFAISKNGVEYQQTDMQKSVGNMLVAMFTGVNSLVLPFIFKAVKKLQNGEIDTQVFKVRIIVIAVIFIICMFFEGGYMKNIQQGILEIYNSNSAQE